MGQHILRVTTKLKINHSRKQKIDPIFDDQTANYEGQSQDKVHEEIGSHSGKICWNCHKPGNCFFGLKTATEMLK